MVFFRGNSFMKWNDKRYHTLNYELKKEFGQKVIKLSLDGGFTCPNRDGTIGDKGCIFCSERGSGDFAAPRILNIEEQIQQQKEFLSKKAPNAKYIAYFQNYTNTYSTIDDLREKYSKAVNSPDVVGLAVATRPDCLSPDILDLLEWYNERIYVWVEMGLQSIHEESSRFIRRGYHISSFEGAMEYLNKKDIRAVAHLIMGIPGESREDMLSSIKYIANQNVWGVKIHLLHILKDTDLYKVYQQTPFSTLSKEEYINLIADSLELLPPEMVIHRVTGDGSKDSLIAPKWSLDKLSVLSGIDRELKERNSYQGIRYQG